MLAKAGQGLYTATGYCALAVEVPWSHPELLQQQLARGQQCWRSASTSRPLEVSVGGARRSGDWETLKQTIRVELRRTD